MTSTLPPLVPRQTDCPGCFLSAESLRTYEASFCTQSLFSISRPARVPDIASWVLASTTDLIFTPSDEQMDSDLESSIVKAPTCIMSHICYFHNTEIVSIRVPVRHSSRRQGFAYGTGLLAVEDKYWSKYQIFFNP